MNVLGDIDWRPTAKFGPCSAVPLPSGLIIYGENAGARPYTSNSNCGNNGDSGVMWYSFTLGYGQSATITTCYPYTNFPATLNVYSGFCDKSLTCVSSSTSVDGCTTVKIPSQTPSMLLVAVSGNNSTTGEFALSVTKTPDALASGNNCSSATNIYPGTTFPTSVVDEYPQTADLNDNLCPSSSKKTAALWYKIMVSEPTMLQYGNYYTGSCDNLVCHHDDSLVVSDYYYTTRYTSDVREFGESFNFDIHNDLAQLSSCENPIVEKNYISDNINMYISPENQEFNNFCGDGTNGTAGWAAVEVSKNYNYIPISTCGSPFPTKIVPISGSCDNLSCYSFTQKSCSNGEMGDNIQVSTANLPYEEYALLRFVVVAPSGSEGIVQIHYNIEP